MSRIEIKRRYFVLWEAAARKEKTGAAPSCRVLRILFPHAPAKERSVVPAHIRAEFPAGTARRTLWLPKHQKKRKAYECSPAATSTSVPTQPEGYGLKTIFFRRNAATSGKKISQISERV